jgi:hypothetical protein
MLTLLTDVAIVYTPFGLLQFMSTISMTLNTVAVQALISNVIVLYMPPKYKRWNKDE